MLARSILLCYAVVQFRNMRLFSMSISAASLPVVLRMLRFTTSSLIRRFPTLRTVEIVCILHSKFIGATRAFYDKQVKFNSDENFPMHLLQRGQPVPARPLVKYYLQTPMCSRDQTREDIHGLVNTVQHPHLDSNTQKARQAFYNVECFCLGVVRKQSLPGQLA